MYETHYGLTGRPFQLTPDPRFWFDTATHKKAMAYLGYGLSQGEGFIVITGDIGAGKTTLVGHLTDTVDADRLNVIKIVSTQIVADDLLRTVCAGLGVNATGLPKAAMLSAIERGLHAVARGGRRTLLIVDEAQALPVDSLEELRMLSNFQAGGHAMLQIFLLGQPEFRDKLHADGLDQLRQRVIAMHHLGPMEADELEGYLVHRLAICGWTGRPRFKTDALATIYAWSGGIPRRINNLVSRVLLHGAMEGIDTFTAADVLAVAEDLAIDGMTGAAPLDALPVIETVEDEPTPLPIQPEPPVEAEATAPIAFEPAVEVEAAPIAAEPPLAPVVAEEPVAMRPVEISTVPRLFDPVALRGRRSILAPVDAAPADAEPAPHVVPTPEPIADEPEPVAEWPFREPVRTEPQALEPTNVANLDLARRLAAIDERMEEQDEALRRVLTLMVDWMETGRGDAGEVRGRAG